MSVAALIEKKLEAALEPVRLEIVDESHLHAGHANAPEGGESHFHVTVAAAAFEGQNLVSRQRKVYEILADELAGPIHALSLSTLTPDEVEQHN